MQLQPTVNGAFRSLDDPGEIGTGVPRGSVTAEEGEILARLARGLDVLEIGTGLGVSTRALASHARLVLTVDIDPWVITNVWPGLRSLDIETERAIPYSRLFDLVFIDGSHTAEQCLTDIQCAVLVLRDPGLLVLHDLHLDGVQEAIKRLGLTVFPLRTRLSLGLAVV